MLRQEVRDRWAGCNKSLFSRRSCSTLRRIKLHGIGVTQRPTPPNRIGQLQTTHQLHNHNRILRVLLHLHSLDHKVTRYRALLRQDLKRVAVVVIATKKWTNWTTMMMRKKKTRTMMIDNGRLLAIAVDQEVINEYLGREQSPVADTMSAERLADLAP